MNNIMLEVNVHKESGAQRRAMVALADVAVIEEFSDYLTRFIMRSGGVGIRPEFLVAETYDDVRARVARAASLPKG